MGIKIECFNHTYFLDASKDYITSGGNSKVYNCSTEGVIIKFFNPKFYGKKQFQRYKRFRAEMFKIKEIIDIEPSITIPVIDFNLPKKYFKPKNFKIFKAPCIVLKKAENCYSEIINKSVLEKIDVFIEIATKLKILHDNNIYHMDIKFQNIMKYNNGYIFIDFGTTKTTKIQGITLDNEKIGSTNTMAPELLYKNQSSSYDYSLADIYSLGKTFWIYLTNDNNSIFEEYDKYSVKFSLKSKNVGFKTYEKIDELLLKSTKINEEERIKIDEFILRLEEIKKYEQNQHLYQEANYGQHINRVVDNNRFEKSIISQEKNIEIFLLGIKNNTVSLAMYSKTLNNINLSISKDTDGYFFEIDDKIFNFNVESIEISLEETEDKKFITKINIKKTENYDAENTSDLNNIDILDLARILFSKVKLQDDKNKFIINSNMEIFIKK